MSETMKFQATNQPLPPEITAEVKLTPVDVKDRIIADDLLSSQEALAKSKAAELSDGLMWGEIAVNSDKSNKLQESINGHLDMVNYLKSRDYQDEDGNFRSGKDELLINTDQVNNHDLYQSTMPESYDDLKIFGNGGLIERLAEALAYDDKTTIEDIDVAINKRILKEGATLSAENIVNMYDRVKGLAEQKSETIKRQLDTSSRKINQTNTDTPNVDTSDTNNATSKLFDQDAPNVDNNDENTSNTNTDTPNVDTSDTNNSTSELLDQDTPEDDDDDIDVNWIDDDDIDVNWIDDDNEEYRKIQDELNGVISNGSNDQDNLNQDLLDGNDHNNSTKKGLFKRIFTKSIPGAIYNRLPKYFRPKDKNGNAIKFDDLSSEQKHNVNTKIAILGGLALAAAGSFIGLDIANHLSAHHHEVASVVQTPHPLKPGAGSIHTIPKAKNPNISIPASPSVFHGLNVNAQTPSWDYASLVSKFNPSAGNPFDVLNKAAEIFNQKYGTNFSLQSHNGFQMFIDKTGSIIDLKQQGLMNQIITTLGK